MKESQAAPKRLDFGAALLLTLLVVGFAWGEMLSLPLSGEDWVILGRIATGEPGSPHVFRPLNDAWLGGLHALLGTSQAFPYHAASLLLHLISTGLLVLVAFELLRSPWGAACVAILFGLGAGVVDSLAWVAAVPRPLSGFGTILAWLGLVSWPSHGRAGLALFFAGFLWQYLSCEEVYGTAFLACTWLGWQGLNNPSLRPAAWGSAALAIAAIVAHYFLLSPVGASRLQLSPSFVASAVATRAAQIAEGLALPPWSGLLLPLVAAGVLLLAGRRRIAAFGALAWAASLFPFVLSEPTRYRAYPSQAPTALLVGSAIFTGLAAGSARALRPALVFLGTAALALLGSELERGKRLQRWRASLAEVAIVAGDARELAREYEEPPVLANLEPSSAGPFYYFFRIVDPQGVRMRGFLDAASAFEEPGDRPSGLWYGRRLDGTYGRIEPELYFSSRPTVEPLRLYDSAMLVSSLDQALEAFADPSLDLKRVALLEAREADVAALVADESPLGSIEVLAPFEHGLNWARMSVIVRASRPALLVYQEHWLFEYFNRLSADQALLTDQQDLRRAAMEAKDRRTGEIIRTLHANAFGFGVLVPAGESELDLAWSVRHP